MSKAPARGQRVRTRCASDRGCTAGVIQSVSTVDEAVIVLWDDDYTSTIRRADIAAVLDDAAALDHVAARLPLTGSPHVDGFLQESAEATAVTPWQRWCTSAAKWLGVDDLDNTQTDERPYSLDDAYAAFCRPTTPQDYANTVLLRGLAPGDRVRSRYIGSGPLGTVQSVNRIRAYSDGNKLHPTCFVVWDGAGERTEHIHVLALLVVRAAYRPYLV